MGMMPIYFTTNNLTRRKRRQTKRAREMQAQNERLIAQLTKGIKKGHLSLIVAEEGTGKTNVAPLSNTISGKVFAKRDILEDYKWKKNSTETEETIEAIKEKASRVTPLFNKGGLQLALPSDDPSLGKRR